MYLVPYLLPEGRQLSCMLTNAKVGAGPQLICRSYPNYIYLFIYSQFIIFLNLNRSDSIT